LSNKLEVKLLGRFEVSHNGKPLAIPSRPAQSLFAYLILSAGTAHRREKLAGMLWPDSLEETARDNLRHALWRVRKALESASATRFLHADDLTIKFEASSDYWLDAAELEKLGETATADEIMEVLARYEGELLPGFYDEWVLLEREHLSSIFEHHMARLMSLLQEEKRWLDILDWGERWIKLGKKPEPAYRALMSAHAAKGDMSKVATTYERCVKSLKEIGIEPSEQTRRLYEKLKAGEEVSKADSITTKSPAKETSSNIPVPLTSFIGRQQELKEIARLLSSVRLLTLTGSGGVGKTRLAIQTANNSIKKFKDGVLWVSLVGLLDGDLIPQEIAQSLNVLEVSNEPLIETLKAYLKSKEVLLVIDNCEHLIRACAHYAEQLLGACPHLKILATSIEALGLFNETIWQVPSLPLPEMQQSLSLKELKEFASIELFHERAGHAKSGFALDERNASAIAQICWRLDGIPLAIELAAARLKLLSVGEIAARLDDRFSLLTAGSRTALPRHQTLRATIDWSYDLLTEQERELFRRLSVFVGGFTLDAAEVICILGELKRSDVLDLLSRLVDKSLVIVEITSTTEETRYHLLETIRQYGLEKLSGSGEAAAIRNQHLEFFMDLVEKAEPELERAAQGVWLDRLELQLDNMRAAIEWALASQRPTSALQMVAGLRRFWLIRNHDSEGIERVRTLLGRSDVMQPTLARLKALNSYFFMLWAHGKLTDVYPLIEEALSLGVELEDSWNTASAFLWAGVSAAEQGNYRQAQSHLQQSREEWQDTTEALPVAMPLVFLGEIAIFQNDFAKAEGLFDAALQRFKEVQDFPFLGMMLRRLGQLAMYQGDLRKATALIREGLVYNWTIHDYRGTGACLAALAAVNVAQGRYDNAAKLSGIVEGILEFTHIPLLPFDQQQYERIVSQLRNQLDVKDFKTFWTIGKVMRLEDAIAFALDEK
jgi:predicted ATPase/DNA-binding SARP family transcriptional activator